MQDKSKIKDLISKMTDDMHNNLENIKNLFGNIDYMDETNQSILHILVDDKYDEKKCFIAIKTLLQNGLSPNLLDYFKYNFIQTALYAGYSEEFILNIITEALKYNLNINHVDIDKDTIMHTAIYSDDYLGGVEKIYELLCANGFNSSLKDKDEKNLLDAIIYQNQYSKLQIESFKKKFQKASLNSYKENNKKDTSPKEESITCIQTISDKEVLELEKYGKILNKKKYIASPTIEREKELKNLMIVLAQDKKRPLLVGESGVGKTAIVDELAYRIKIGQVPSFLQDKIILEVNPSDIVAGCKYVGMFEENMINLMKLCERYEVIVFIDEIHTIYGIGSSKGKDNDMAMILKHYIDRSNLKVIGVTTDVEYNEFFSGDALKRRFEKIVVKEPTDDVLEQIIDKVTLDYCIKTGISFENDFIRKEIVSSIISATSKNRRVYNDIVNNPDLSISIIDRAFALAKVYDSNFITVEHFIESFEYCDRIYTSAKELTIARLNSLNELNKSVSKQASKVLKIDFNRLKR